MMNLPKPAIRIASVLLLILVCETLSGCGIRGPLVLPEPERKPAGATGAEK